VVLANQMSDFSKPWLTVSLTLFVVALALLVLILRDQHRAITAIQEAEATAEEAAAQTAAGQAAPQPGADPAGQDSGAAQLPGDPPAAGVHLAHVERGRIASLGGVVSVIYLVILVLMVWNG